jgi:5-methylcytosine-specific restriction endonuclease McrA
MKGLACPRAQYRRHLRRALEPAELTSFSATVDSTCRLARAYSRQAPELHRIRTTITDPDTRDFFYGLYDMNRISVKEIRKSVRDGLTAATGSRCQYCGFPAPSTLDHFLEKANIPELSLFARNMVPCCPTCQHRGPTFASDGSRRILHFYFDDVDTMPEVLIATIDFPAGSTVPVASYSIAPSAHPLVDIYRRHFNAVHLDERYENEARGQLLVIRENVQRGMPLSAADVAAQLQGEAESEAKIYGRNNHMSALYQALTGSPPALAWLMTP